LPSPDTSPDTSGGPTSESLLDLLTLEELDTDLYRGINESSALDWPALFGGQVAAQALRAASHTVPEGRLPHSLHGYFLRPGRASRPVILRVARDRDGRSFSARHVVAVQNGEVIFSMSASFHAPENGAEYVIDRPAAGTARPDELPEWMKGTRFESTLHIRPFPPVNPYGKDEFPVPARMWVRSVEKLPDDPLIHACVLAYVSDIGSGFGDGTAQGVPRGGPSIDHAVWFQNDIRMDQWALLETWPLKAGGARGLYHGWIHDSDGRMGAMLTQEIIFRPRKGPLPRPLFANLQTGPDG
jgi:acyl-CoA thioesterase II